MKTSILKISSYAGAANIIELILALLTAGLSIRFLGLEDAGFFLFFESLIQVNGGLFNLGFQSAVTKQAGQAIAEGNELKARRLFEVGMTIDLIAVFIPGFTILLLAPLIIEYSGYTGSSSPAIIYIYFSIASLILSKLTLIFTVGLVTRHAFGIVSAYRIISNITTNLVRIGILVWIPSLPTLGCANTLSLLLGTCFLAVVCIKRNGYIPKLSIRKTEISELWNFSKWEYAWNLSSMLTANLDRILIVKYFGLTMLPIYSMSKRVLTLGHRFIVGFTDYFFPLLSGQTKKDRATMIQKLEYPLPWGLFCLGAIVYGTAVILGPNLLDLMVGDQFGSRALPGILGFTIVGMTWLVGVLPYYVARSDGKTYLNTYVAVSNSAIVFTSIWIFAYQGSFVSTIFCQALVIPAFLIQYQILIPGRSLLKSFMHQIKPTLGFTFVWAFVLLSYFASDSFNKGWPAAVFFEALLLIATGFIILYEIIYGKDMELKKVFQKLFRFILPTLKKIPPVPLKCSEFAARSRDV
ncbi:oligosaccharide flippase family protein [Coraliomargarita algicola]|uniref:Oligosaccharide flippase family protein n=1 Tax=Coraliomargarita algicola TaxID=3092156 RepID=A0ABZ0RQI0_9BACT|nr:oligosaccharide flippase family protein [Coraliomargarita sp. J2-16]WPJ97371.1 oligosaccharide flippase family protein [Coraliomargarita sp. J2-16]